jgi:hypothetical protein
MLLLFLRTPCLISSSTSQRGGIPCCFFSFLLVLVVWGHQPVDGRHLLLATFRRAHPAACLEGSEGNQWITVCDGSGEIDAWTGEVALEDAGKTSSPPSSSASAPQIAAALPPSSQVRGAARGSLAALVEEAGHAAWPLYSYGPSGRTMRVSGTGWPS